MLPTLPFNTSEDHASFRGTVTLSPATVMLVFEEVVAGLREQGVTKQVLTVGHGSSLRRGAFLKHVNRCFGDAVVVDAHNGAQPTWEEALRQAALDGRCDVHGGVVSRALAAYLKPELVKDGAYGTEVPEHLGDYADYVGWERIVADGSWGRYDPTRTPRWRRPKRAASSSIASRLSGRAAQGAPEGGMPQQGRLKFIRLTSSSDRLKWLGTSQPSHHEPRHR